MKLISNIGLCLGLCLMTMYFTGCAAVKQNTNEIAQLKNQMINVESVLTSQNLLIQQNKNEISSVADRLDDVSMSAVTKENTYKTTESSSAASYSAPSIKKTSAKTTILSDKLQPQPTIKEIQSALRNAGFYIGEIDGKVGTLTRDAVKKFQKANQLTADGVVGKQTWAKMKDYL